MRKVLSYKSHLVVCLSLFLRDMIELLYLIGSKNTKLRQDMIDHPFMSLLS